jgi:hypothetical protein
MIKYNQPACFCITRSENCVFAIYNRGLQDLKPVQVLNCSKSSQKGKKAPKFHWTVPLGKATNYWGFSGRNIYRVSFRQFLSRYETIGK